MVTHASGHNLSLSYNFLLSMFNVLVAPVKHRQQKETQTVNRRFHMRLHASKLALNFSLVQSKFSSHSFFETGMLLKISDIRFLY